MSKRPSITREDFDAWRGNAVTERFMQHASDLGDRILEFWNAQLSAQTPLDPLMLTLLQVELKAKREIVESLKSLTLEDIEEDNADARASEIGRIAKAAAQAAQAAKGKGH